MPESKGTTDYCLSKPLVEMIIRTLIPIRDVWLNNTTGGRGGVIFFTDGFKISDRIGFGVYSKHLDLSIVRCLPSTAVFTKGDELYHVS